jgi:hypothetical protein
LIKNKKTLHPLAPARSTLALFDFTFAPARSTETVKRFTLAPARSTETVKRFTRLLKCNP